MSLKTTIPSRIQLLKLWNQKAKGIRRKNLLFLDLILFKSYGQSQILRTKSGQWMAQRTNKKNEISISFSSFPLFSLLRSTYSLWKNSCS